MTRARRRYYVNLTPHMRQGTARWTVVDSRGDVVAAGPYTTEREANTEAVRLNAADKPAEGVTR